MLDREGTPRRRIANSKVLSHSFTIGVGFTVASLAASAATVTMFWADRQKQPESASIEGELNKTLRGMESNAQQASRLLERLQVEVTARTQALQEAERTIKELQKQRSLLDLSPEQRSALRDLLGRNPSVREIFSSLDFWLGRFLVSLCFFGLGVWFTLWRSRKPPPSDG